MNDFRYHAPDSVDDALRLLQGADDGKLLAGGMSLLPLMKLNLAAPSDVISLANVPGLSEIAERDGQAYGEGAYGQGAYGGAGHAHIEIGALCTHDQVAASSAVRRRIPALAEMASGIGDPQVRNRGTIGGSLAHNDPAADYPAACLALGASVTTDRRELTADDFFQGMFATALEDDEIVVSVRFPVPERAGWAKFANPASKYAVAGVMVAQGPAGTRVAVTGASGDGAFRAGDMETALSRSFAAGALDDVEVSPDEMLSDGAAGPEYRAHLVRVMAKRAVEACA